MDPITAQWYSHARIAGYRYREQSRGYGHAQLGPMIIVGNSTRVAGEDGHIPGPLGCRFVDPIASNVD